MFRFRLVVPALLVVVLAAVLASSALAAPKPPPAQTAYVTLGAISFHPGYSDLYYTTNSGGMLTTLPTTTASNTWYFAPLQLPQNAELTSFVGYMLDNDPRLDAGFGFRVIGLATANGGASLLAGSGDGASPDLRTVERSVPTNWADRFIDNESRAYYAIVDLPVSNAQSGLQFNGVKVFYRYVPQ